MRSVYAESAAPEKPAVRAMSEIQAKAKYEQLAVTGGEPLFAQKMHVGKPSVPCRDGFIRQVEAVLDSGWLSNNGPRVRALETRLAEYLGVRHCVLVCNATLGLQVAVRALDLQGEVIVPSMTFIATPHALEWQRLAPVFCDIDPRTHLIDPQCVEAAITPRTSAVLGVHLWGNPCDVPALDDIARRHGLTVLYDAAHAFGCATGTRMVGGFGACEVFSFHATKFFSTFEGGAIATDDDALARRLRRMINFGFEAMDRVADVGLNGKMSEVCAAMGLASWPGLEAAMRVNESNFRAYERALQGIEGVRLLPVAASRPHNFQYVVLEYTAPQGAIDRDGLVDVLWAENVIARRYFHPGCHRAAPYDTPQRRATAPPLVHTEAATQRVIVLPTGPAIGPQACEQIGAVIRCAVEAGPRLAQRFGLGRTARSALVHE
jgi:dTDP-4-amino-4,6-dideoxygalactose transaminase